MGSEKLSTSADMTVREAAAAAEVYEGEFSPAKVVEEFERLTMNAEKVQREVLQKILEENKEVEYLKKMGLNGQTDPEAFKRCVPLVRYSDLKPYVDKIVAGEVSGVLTGKPVTKLCHSSGTSQGKPKICPFTEETMDAFVQSVQTSYAYRNRVHPVDETKMSLRFLYMSKTSVNEAGLTVGFISTFVLGHPKFKIAFRPKASSPDEVMSTLDQAQAQYCHLLMGLKHRHQIQYIFSVYSHTMVAAFESLSQLWEELCHDIHHGAPSATRVTSDSLRSIISSHLGRPDPDAAHEISRICDGLAKNGWERLVPSLFPNAKYLHGVMTGPAENYIGRLKFYGGDLPLMGMDYGATEGWVATNIHPRFEPEKINFTIIPNIAYFEFIPLDEVMAEKDGERFDLHPVGLTDVEVGQKYELVFTNFQGMYRYRLGDWVEVTGFHNSTPMIKYLCRGHIVLSILIDKNTEKDLQVAVDAATRHLTGTGIDLVDYTSRAESAPENRRYIIFWEMSGVTDQSVELDRVLQKCCNDLDAGFVDLGYVSSRASRNIGPLELRVVGSGTFQKVLEHYMSSRGGGNVAQFKMPRCVKNESVLRILEENSVKSYFSTAYK